MKYIQLFKIKYPHCINCVHRFDVSFGKDAYFAGFQHFTLKGLFNLFFYILKYIYDNTRIKKIS